MLTSEESLLRGQLYAQGRYAEAWAMEEAAKARETDKATAEAAQAEHDTALVEARAEVERAQAEAAATRAKADNAIGELRDAYDQVTAENKELRRILDLRHTR